MQISFVGDHQIFSLFSPFQQAERESEEKTRPKRWKGLFFFLTQPRFVLVRPHSMHRFSAFLTYTQPLSVSPELPLRLHSFLRGVPPPTLPPSLAHFCFSLSFRLSRWTSVSASNSNSNSNSFIGMTRESLAWPHSPCLALHKATRPGPVTSGLAWSTGCVMLRRGRPSLVCRVRSVDSHTMGMSASCSREGQLWQGFSVWSYTDYHCPLIPGLFCLRVWNVFVPKSSYSKSKALRVSVHMCAYCVECKSEFTYNKLSAIRTCARHLEGIRVSAIVAIAANAVDGAFACCAAVDGTLHTGLISLCRLEKARGTGWKTQGGTHDGLE